MKLRNGNQRYFSDPIDHDRHIAFLRSRAQAKFRGEPWSLTINDYFALWHPQLWAQRGRKVNDLAMTRLNPELPWSIDNVSIQTRGEILKHILGLEQSRKYKRPVGRKRHDRSQRA